MISSILKKKLLPAAIAVALASGALLSNNVNAVHISAENKGQLLMAPIYLARFGYNTKVSIINTRNDVAVKARIALRSHKFSDEFDFICMMTPSDVCTFEITRGADGQAYLTSSDDSILASETKATFASQCGTSDAGEFCDSSTGQLKIKVLDYAIRTTSDGTPIDDNEMGHIEVLGAWAVSGRVLHPAGTQSKTNSSGFAIGGSEVFPPGAVTITEGMPKQELYKLMGPFMDREKLVTHSTDNDETLSYSTGRTVNDACVNTPPSDGYTLGAPCSVDNYQIARENTARDNGGDFSNLTQKITIISGVVNYSTRITNSSDPAFTHTAIGNTSKIRSTDPSWIQLVGQVELNNGKDRMGLQMTALTGDVWDALLPEAHTPTYGMFSGEPSSINGVASFAFDGRVISNPTYDVKFASEVVIGSSFGGSRVGAAGVAGVGRIPSYDNIIEIENALSASSLVGRFENQNGDSTNLVITFPTKYRHDSSVIFQEGRKNPGDKFPVGPIDLGDNNDKSDVCASELTAPGQHFTSDGTFDQFGTLIKPALEGHLVGNPTQYELRDFYPPFRPEGSIQYNLDVWDDQENLESNTVALPIFSPGVGDDSTKTITDEVNYMFVPWPTKEGFGSGWFRLTFNETNGCQYKGTPVIAYAHKTQSTADGFVNSWLVQLTKEGIGAR